MKQLPAIWLALSVTLMVWVTSGPAAIINKQMSRVNHGSFDNPADMVSVIFNNGSRVRTAMSAVIAVVLLGAGAATLAGVWQTVRGERGGVSLTLSGIYGILGLMAALAVIQ